jgi:hypothetical protein
VARPPRCPGGTRRQTGDADVGAGEENSAAARAPITPGKRFGAEDRMGENGVRADPGFGEPIGGR